jgi:hypothetical protein
MPNNANATATIGTSWSGIAGTDVEVLHTGSGKKHWPASSVPHCPWEHEVLPFAQVIQADPQSAAAEHVVPN